ncbi:MAG: aminotransferase class I/II-fold pyridoxal phosphate-dependent enzyme [Acidobacteriota bacterium]
MSLRPFALERYFARYEFSTPHLLSSSDCEALTLTELLSHASPADRLVWDNLSLGYTESPGHPVLRAAIAHDYPGLSPNDILTAVPEEAIYLAMRTLLSPGDHVVVTFPGYQSLYEIARSLGCHLHFWQSREEDGQWHFPLADLEALLAHNPTLVVVNFPHNPTGATLSPTEWQSLIDLVSRSGARLFSDEMYRGLEANRKPLPPAATLLPNALSLAGLSKAYGLAGLRLGWLATRDTDALSRLQTYKDYTTICSPAPVEHLALIALHNAEKLRLRAQLILEQNRPLLADFLSRHSHTISGALPAAGPVCFLRYHGPSASAFAEHAASTHGLMLLPSTVYDYGDSHLRLGLGRLSFPDALDRLSAALELQ